jgi:hypothetical protein
LREVSKLSKLSFIVAFAVHIIQDFPSFSEMDFFGVLGDPFGSEYRGQTDFIDEDVETLPEQHGDVGGRDVIEILNVFDGLGEPLFREIAVEDSLVDIFPTAFEVDESDDVVEDSHNLVSMSLIFPEGADRPFDDCFGTFFENKVSEKVVYDV